MAETLTPLFYYLNKEDIIIDKQEFLFQIQSHPNYPSLLSISDALTFFNIKNGAIAVEKEKIHLLPDFFLTFLNEENTNPQLYFIEKENDKFFCKKDGKKNEISKLELESRWNNIIFLLEKTDIERSKLKDNNLLLPLLLLISIFSLVLLEFNANLQSIVFFCIIFVGVLFSIAALKDLLGAKNKLISDFCNITTTTNCNTIVNSNKWKIFKIFNYSDLSLIFFVSQFAGLLLFTISENSSYFFSLQKILLLISIPIIISSIYFQRFVEKKWCPICLVIIGVILIELFYIVLFIPTESKISNKYITLYFFVFVLISTSWLFLKRNLLIQKDLKDIQLKSNRFIRNSNLFKSALISKPRIKLPEIPIVLGNKGSKIAITVISNPFCGHCKDAHIILHRILEKYPNDLQINIIFRTDFEKENDKNKKFYRTLYKVYDNNSSAEFEKAVNYWFYKKDVQKWLDLYGEEDSTKYDYILESHYDWCNENNIAFTPCIFINNYEFPNIYEKSNLEFYIEDLIEDLDFLQDIEADMNVIENHNC